MINILSFWLTMFILMKLVSYGSATTQKIYWSVAITQVLVYNLYPFEIRS